MFVYVIRWEMRVNGDVSCGNFELCYSDEKAAEKAMLADMKNVEAAWVFEHVVGVTSKKGRKNENGCVDYCHVQRDDWDDYHQWWIDKLEMAKE